ncbi:MAG: two component transcriptional regulator, LuxR family [Agromyces sp.]|nr:two component transcriptional regulator, LuxR family [Agromyces sp.]
MTADGGGIRLVLVDDQALVRAGFRLILERAGLDVVGEAENGEIGVAMVADTAPDVVLMDIRMPVMDGIEATRRIVAHADPPRVLALTTFDDDEYVYAAVRAGASGFMLKDAPPADLVHAVGVVARGEAMLAPPLTARLLDRFATVPGGPGPNVDARLSDLTERELEIVRLVARGFANAEIGRTLFLSESTVKTYVSRVLGKLGVHDRVQIAILAYESGLVRPGERAS